MKKYLLPSGIFILLFASSALSQTPTPAPKPPENQNAGQATEENSDLVITATVRARELKFEIVPNPKVTFPGSPESHTVWEADRENLPEKVEPGVVYRDIGIRLRIFSRFAEIQRIVLEAIDEEQKAATNLPVGSSSGAAKSVTEQPGATTETSKTRKPVTKAPKK